MAEWKHSKRKEAGGPGDPLLEFGPPEPTPTGAYILSKHNALIKKAIGEIINASEEWQEDSPFTPEEHETLVTEVYLKLWPEEV